MLREGVICPSTNSFSSPVLLVRKKDVTQTFYVDYRALNAITVRDRFPIPTIDELFDELHGVHYYTRWIYYPDTIKLDSDPRIWLRHLFGPTMDIMNF